MNKQIGRPHMINMVNRNLIFEIIKEKGPISKPDIVKITRLSLPTVNKIIGVLQEDGLVKEFGIGETPAGRKPILYTVNEKAGYIIAIYIEDNEVKGVITDITGGFLKEGIVKRSFDSTQDVLHIMLELIDHLLSQVNNPEDIKGIGIGVPGVVRKDGSIINISSIPEWESLNLKKILEEKYQTPIYLENDVNLTAVGIYYDKFCRKYKNIVYIYFGKGIGSGIIIDSKLYKGANCFAGEISNFIMELDGDFKFGKKHTRYIEYQINKVVKEILINNNLTNTCELKTTMESLTKYDTDMQRLVNYISYLVNNVVCLLDPEAIILRGDYIGKKFFKRIKRNLINLNDAGKNPKIMMLDDPDIGIKGTIRLCLSQINPNYLLIINKGI